MYTLTDEQVASLEGFIAKIPESIIRAKVEKWLSEVEPTRRVDSDQMERFVEFKMYLPVELQHYPVSFALAVKNTPETDRREAAGEGSATEYANLIGIVDESISDVPDADAPINVEETEHQLGKVKRIQKVTSKSKAKGKK